MQMNVLFFSRKYKFSREETMDVFFSFFRILRFPLVGILDLINIITAFSGKLTHVMKTTNVE